MIKLNGVSKKFATGSIALSGIDLEIDKGEFLFLVGPTGSGKTTLFRILIRDLTPSEGSVTIDELDILKLPKNKIPEFRKMIGVVFQDLKLISDRTIFENVSLPLDVIGEKAEIARDKVEKVLKQVGILEHKDKFPVQLSGGELQRAAIARALVLSPQIILADEPTGNLDLATSWEIVNILSDINKAGTTIIMATHNADIVRSMDKRTVHVEKGKIVKDENKKKPASKEEKQKTKSKDEESESQVKNEEEKSEENKKEKK